VTNEPIPHFSRGHAPFIRSSLCGALLAVAFLFLHLIRLSHHGFWIDELHTFGSISNSWSKMLSERLSAGHLPTYFILMKVWCGLTAHTEWWMRFPSVVFATFAFFAFFLLVRDFITDDRIFSVAVALCFFHPFLLWASHDARMYSLLICASTLAAHQVLSYVGTGKSRHLIVYSVAALIGLCVHMLFLIQILTHAVFLAAHHRSLLKRHLIAAAIPLALLLPVTFLAVSRTKEYSPGLSPKFPDVFFVARKMAAIASTDFACFLRYEEGWVGKVSRNLGGFFFTGLLVLGVLHLRERAKKAPRSGASDTPILGDAPPPDRALLLLRYCFYWMGVQGVVMAISLVFNNDKVGMTRYYSPLLGAALVLAAFELGTPGRARWRCAFGWAYLAFFVFAIGVQLNWQGPGIREAFQVLRKEIGPNDGVVFSHAGALRYAFDLYDCEDMDRLPLSREREDRESLIRDIRSFARGKDRLWLLLHNVKRSSLPDLLEDFPAAFEPFEDREILGTRLKGYKIKTLEIQ
jgi:hypothetical protein